MNKSKNEWGIIELQDKILEIMLFVHKLCVANDIIYFLMGGSALGAIRHNGFIPWDDDLDIFMTVSNYRKFKNAFSLIENKKYHLQEWAKCENMISMAKVRDSTTTLIEHSIKDWNINHGVYIDIFILHAAAPTLRKMKIQCFWARYLIAKGLSKKDYKAKNIFQKIVMFFLRLTPNRFLVRHALKNIYKYENTEPKKYVHFIGRAGIESGVYCASWFSHPVLHKFENIELYVPCELEQYVIARWGKSYMIPPSLNQIRRMQHPSIWDVNSSYTENPKYKLNDKKDENKLVL